MFLKSFVPSGNGTSQRKILTFLLDHLCLLLCDASWYDAWDSFRFWKFFDKRHSWKFRRHGDVPRDALEVWRCPTWSRKRNTYKVNFWILLWFYAPASEASREFANLTWRKNPLTPIDGVKEFVCLSVCLKIHFKKGSQVWLPVQFLSACFYPFLQKSPFWLNSYLNLHH